jgi:hypothetical protein
VAAAMLNRFAIPAAALIAAPSIAHADDFQQWLQAGAKVNLSDKVVLSDEIVGRFSDDRDGLYEIENSLLLGYKIGKKSALWAGYVHDPNYDGGSFTVMERRAREQLTVDDFATIGKVSLSGRFRLEQRWRDGASGTGWRTRPYLKLALPLGDKGSPSLNFTEEAFINLNNTAFQSKDGLERLRTAASISLPLSKVLKLEAGYLNQHRFVTNAPDTDDHVVTASLGFSF